LSVFLVRLFGHEGSAVSRASVHTDLSVVKMCAGETV
jgi:hypothetical protein